LGLIFRACRPFVAATALALSACGGSGNPVAPAGSTVVAPAGKLVLARRTPRGKIAHVVIIVQENRTVDNLFQGYPGADTQSFGYTSTGRKVTLVPLSLGLAWDIDHTAKSFFAACDGRGSLPGTKCKMDGFDKELVGCGHGPPPCPNSTPEYAYVPHSETKPYFAIAQQYVLADRMFASNFDGSSFVSHQYLIAGQANSTIDFPSTVWGCDGGPQDTIATVTEQRAYGNPIQACFDNLTLGDELDAAGVSWRYYTTNLNDPTGNLWSAYQAIRHIRYGADWKNVVDPQTRFFKDAQTGNLPAVSWVTPTCRNSDHAGCDTNDGPHWVASLVNAVGTSKYWNSTAIFIVWDDFGGWYDHVPPPLVDYDGLGIRVPLLVVSAYAKKSYVSHVRYENGSILKFVEDQFGLPRLAASDARAMSPQTDCFDFSQPPRAFVPIPSRLSPADLENEPSDPRPPDNQ
jgi:phospholipase C